jgi:hypothetical protein
MRTTVAVLCLAALAGCKSQAPPAPAQAVRAGAAGVTVLLPEGWHTTAPDDGRVVDPVTRVAVSSGPMANRHTECQIANYGPEDDAVSLVVVEWKSSSDGSFAPRPPRFGAEEPPANDGAIECFDGAGGSVEFLDGGRNFGAYLLLGPDADPGLADEARAVLETLEVEPAA